MVDQSLIIAYQMILSLVGLGFLAYVYSQLSKTVARTFFTFITFAFLLYCNLLCVYYHPLRDAELAEWVSKSIFAASVIYTTLVVHLLLYVTNPETLKKYHYRLFLLSQAFFFVMSFTPFLQRGLVLRDGLFRPVHGVLYLPFILSFLFWWGYVIIFAIRGYRKQEIPLLKRQSFTLIVTALSVLTLTLISNGLIPALFGSSQLSVLGAFWYLILMIGIGKIVSSESAYNIKPILQKISKMHKQLDAQNREAFLKGLEYLQKAFDPDDVAPFKKKVPLRLMNKIEASLYISRVRPEDEEGLDLTRTIPKKWIEGLMDSHLQLEQDNFGLALGLHKVLATNPEALNGEITKYLPLPLQESLNENAVEKLLEADLEAEPDLSPLEVTEKRVIAHYLAKNKYNKNRTRIELDITVNTLNAKIRKYNLWPDKLGD